MCEKWSESNLKFSFLLPLLILSRSAKSSQIQHVRLCSVGLATFPLPAITTHFLKLIGIQCWAQSNTNWLSGLRYGSQSGLFWTGMPNLLLWGPTALEKRPHQPWLSGMVANQGYCEWHMLKPKQPITIATNKKTNKVFSIMLITFAYYSFIIFWSVYKLK